MSPIEPVNPTLPGNWVRRVEEKRRKDQPPRRRPDNGGRPGDRDTNQRPAGSDPDGRPHIIDDLA